MSALKKMATNEKPTTWNQRKMNVSQSFRTECATANCISFADKITKSDKFYSFDEIPLPQTFGRALKFINSGRDNNQQS